MDRQKLGMGILLITVTGILLRLTGLEFQGVDYIKSLLPWYQGLAQNGTLQGLAEYNGDYNIPYVTLLYFLTKIPVDPLISIKFSSVFFDLRVDLHQTYITGIHSGISF